MSSGRCQAQESRTAFRKALANANATSTKCLHGAKSAEDFQNIPKTQACVGDVFTELQKAAGDSLAVLQGFDGTVSGYVCHGPERADQLRRPLPGVGGRDAADDRQRDPRRLSGRLPGPQCGLPVGSG